jgi:hypothetical protein
MALHDRYARVTPYELSFPSLEWARDAFHAVREEAALRGVDRTDPALFILLGSVGRMLQELRPEGEDPERIHPLGVLLFHAFHFWEAGEPLLLIETEVVRRLIESRDPTPWSGAIPAAAGYVQLPQHLLWIEGDAQPRPESVDGWFWTSPPGGGEIHVLLASGVQGDRPGFSVVPLPPASLERAEEWADQPGRESGEDFASRMPGAELARLYRVGTPGEVLKLVSRIFAFVADHPGPLRAPEPHGAPPRPSLLKYRRVGEV